MLDKILAWLQKKPTNADLSAQLLALAVQVAELRAIASDTQAAVINLRQRDGS